MLCTTAYTLARADARDDALTMIREATRAARALPDAPVRGGLTRASVTLYEVGVHWALGDAGTALHAGRGLSPAQFETPERRARLHTDLARAWRQWGRAEQAAVQLLDACRAAPAEVRERPAIRAVAAEPTERHCRLVAVRTLRAAVRGSGPARPFSV
ncbi:hypothetical protein RM780_14150 [Streptomyces sp. DSM 44917]|uniref:Transcriptional regulator n=1 Tax=Streptomyces boetiae TaxID=3075541 RepID=A0ABU2L9Z0_9ACTN|nr:hypothetical protein [Streptomyces sp. DSM 44917]MDT0308098.1 hypothetical protein [Streptomyces sp. DSM 44917]